MAIETLKDFEKRDVKVASSAATNLSFLYFLVGFVFDNLKNWKYIFKFKISKENDLLNAHKYSDLSLKADKYNPAGLSNNSYFDY